MRRLAQELRALQGAKGLPLQAAAAILLRHDGDRPDKMRALITGAAAFTFMALVLFVGRAALLTHGTSDRLHHQSSRFDKERSSLQDVKYTEGLLATVCITPSFHT